MKLDLGGRTALVTGASKGIGLACAEVLAEEGCHQHLAARDGAALEAAAVRLRASCGVRVQVHALDLGTTRAIERLAADAGACDILINNAGDVPPGPRGMPAALVAEMHAVMQRVLADADPQRRLVAAGLYPLGRTVSSAEYQQIHADFARVWGPVVREARITIE